MDLYYKQEIAVGALVIAALVILIALLMWLTGRSITSRGRMVVPVQFTMVSGLTEGDPVQISGVGVGRVARVELAEVGRVLVYIEVDRRVRPRADARAEVGSLDFLGAKYVSYMPGEADELLPDDGVILGGDEVELASSAVRLTEQATQLLQSSQDLLSENMVNQVRQTLAATERAMNVVGRVGAGPIVEDAAATLGALKSAARALDSTLSNPGINESLSQLDEIAESVQEMTQGLAAVTTSLALLLEQMRSPEGSMGKMLTDSTLYVDMHETLQSLRMLLDDVRARPGRYINVTVF
jgi:phospholipid/cholesterol/gamma-HCH transport system substrate-binding protein